MVWTYAEGVNVVVGLVGPGVTLPLRHRVLRPHKPVETVLLPGEHGPGATHVAAQLPGGEVVGSAVLLREGFGLMPDRSDAWRLRGMATDERMRGQGIGSRVLGYVIGYVGRNGGGVLWCHARVPARRFYQRAGFSAVGDQWDDPHFGPHVVMWREVAAHTRAAGEYDASLQC